jgi:NADPH-dependent 2,4-dienoyl-CoA reductase/sulfur reductase-like enzyme
MKRPLPCDLLVIGSGPAGLMAALTAGAGGADVILAEEDSRLGGKLISTAAPSTAACGDLGGRGEAELRSLAQRPHHDPHHRDRRL